MNTLLRSHADFIIQSAIRSVQPENAVTQALAGAVFPGRIILIAAGKAAWPMAHAAHQHLGSRIEKGLIITKYHHNWGPIGAMRCIEAGHPIPDENSFAAAREALTMVSGLQKEDTVLFLLSGGASALFESPLVEPEELQRITGLLLASGANIGEMNTIRKRLSAVKGGRFALACAPARVYSIVLSDVLGDALDVIASGPAVPDPSTREQALAIADRYALPLSDKARALLERETPKSLPHAESHITGSVRLLCRTAADAAAQLGYEPILLTDHLCCQAREAGSFLASILKTHAASPKPLAFIAGGETVVQVRGKGLGGRNQELALSAAPLIAGQPRLALFSLGSDGTDGPTDAAGGYVDGDTCARLAEAGLDVYETLQNNDAYHALEKAGGLIKTGPTGTNVNDVAVALVQEDKRTENAL